MQAHSMNYNLILVEYPRVKIGGLQAEITIKTFINKDLGVEGDIEFHNFHRQKLNVDMKPRNNIVKFTKYSDHEKVSTAAFEKPQYPQRR